MAQFLDFAGLQHYHNNLKSHTIYDYGWTADTTLASVAQYWINTLPIGESSSGQSYLTYVKPGAGTQYIMQFDINRSTNNISAFYWEPTTGQSYYTGALSFANESNRIADLLSSSVAQMATKTDVSNLQTNINNAVFSNTKTYSVGDIVVKDNKVYQCKTAVSTAGAWDSSKWNQIFPVTNDNKNKILHTNSTSGLLEWVTVSSGTTVAAETQANVDSKGSNRLTAIKINDTSYDLFGYKYELVATQPVDWTNACTNYYTRSGSAGSYIYTQASSGATWAANTYYERSNVLEGRAIRNSEIDSLF